MVDHNASFYAAVFITKGYDHGDAIYIYTITNFIKKTFLLADPDVSLLIRRSGEFPRHNNY